MPSTCHPRRTLISAAALALAVPLQAARASGTHHPDARWAAAAQAMRRLAASSGDQDYGAVLVLGQAVAGEGPSRVVKEGNPDAHAERVALRDAQRRLGRADLSGSVLYSTSRPCSRCEAAAAAAGVSRMYFGERMTDAGVPAPQR